MWLNHSICFLGCEVEINWTNQPYKNLVTSSVLAGIYQENATELGVPHASRQEQEAANPEGSTDMGNVSQFKPAIHPGYYMCDDIAHSPEFRVKAGTEQAQRYTLIAAKSMARTCLHVMCNPELMKRINSEFIESVKEQGGELDD